jgi:hypothetical protein
MLIVIHLVKKFPAFCEPQRNSCDPKFSCNWPKFQDSDGVSSKTKLWCTYIHLACGTLPGACSTSLMQGLGECVIALQYIWNIFTHQSSVCWVWVLCYDWRSSDSCGFVDVGRPLSQEDRSVIYNCCWPCVLWDSRPYFTVSDSRLPFSSPPMTRRAVVEVFDPTSTRDLNLLYCLGRLLCKN